MARDEAIEYRLIMVQPESRKVLTIETMEGGILPSVRILPWARPAEHLRKAVRAKWGLHIFILDVFRTQSVFRYCAIAELLISDTGSGLKPATLNAIVSSELDEGQRVHVVSLLSGETCRANFQIGWIDQAIMWVESETGERLLSKNHIEQYNAGGAFSLIRFHMRDDRNYWLKATGEPNTHELRITRILAQLGGTYLPEMISVRPEWNAWLMSGEATPVTELPADPSRLFRLLGDAVESMARLQMKTEGHSLDLLDAGAFDQGMDIFEKHSEALFDYFGESMSTQTSTKLPPIDRTRLAELRTMFEDVCRRTEDLGLPKTIVHGDMNQGNILTRCGRCQFIDWSEAYVGNPLVTLQHLLLFNRVENPEIRAFLNASLKDRYRHAWLTTCDPSAISSGFIYMPLLAIVSTFYGRGDWLTSSRRNDPRRQTYARNLARHMDKAARAPDLLEALSS
jgi:hypothetical protein